MHSVMNGIERKEQNGMNGMQHKEQNGMHWVMNWMERKEWNANGKLPKESMDAMTDKKPV